MHQFMEFVTLHIGSKHLIEWLGSMKSILIVYPANNFIIRKKIVKDTRIANLFILHYKKIRKCPFIYIFKLII